MQVSVPERPFLAKTRAHGQGGSRAGRAGQLARFPKTARDIMTSLSRKALLQQIRSNLRNEAWRLKSIRFNN